jgi:HEPN domain-containing protein
LPRKTDSSNPADWLFIVESDLEGLRLLAEREAGYSMCRSKMAEVVEKILKAELLRMGWFLEKTHDLERLSGEMRVRGSDLMPQLDPLYEAFTEACFSDRYPGFDLEDPDWPKLREQLEQVTALAQTVKARLSGKFRE